MSGRQWNPAQRSAIEDEGGALLVSAAAGSGKTAVLVERAVRMMTREADPVPADRILILTFTNAAAEELRGRIASRLGEALRQNPRSAALQRQRMLLGRAFIGTMDAFCIQLVREHFAALDLPPDVAVGEGALLDSLSAEALAETMEEMYADEAFAAFAALYGRARTDLPAEEKVLALYNYTLTLPGQWRRLQQFAAMYADSAPLEQTPWGRVLLDHARAAQEEMAQLAAAMADLCEREDCLAPCAGTAEGYANMAGRLGQALQAGNWDLVREVVHGASHGTLRGKPNRDGSEQAQYDLLKSHRDTIKKVLEELASYCLVCTAAEFEEDRRAAAPMVAALTRAALLYGEKYAAAKLGERALDFVDFEHYALALLQGPDGVRTELGKRVCQGWDAVMVDEYQDTNELQSALYELLGREDGANLFYVGDVKQSIYRFRKANPGIFLQKKEAWAPHATGKHPAQLSLGHNYRSGQAVIDGVNYIFGQLMSPALGEMAYGPDERLVAGRESGLPGGFGLHILETGQAADEAAYVARRIKAAVDAGVEVEEDGLRRPCGYGDFCILMRTGKKAALFAGTLEEAGIPVAASRGEGLLDCPEVLPLTAALAAIDNPGDDVSLAAAMLGPMFRFTPGEVTCLRTAAPRGRLWAALARSGDEKAEAFMRQLRWYRALAGAAPVGLLCEELVQRTGYLSAVAAMENGAARRDNLRRFMGWASEVGKTGRGGLAGFVRLVQNGGGPKPPPARIVPGHVSILTIHGSKGLEFPFVFLCDAARGFNLGELGGRVQLHTELGVGITLRNGGTLYRTLPAMAIRRRLLGEALGEELRLLYVALTRAKQFVAVTFCEPDPIRLLGRYAAATRQGCPSPFRLMMERSMAGWLLCALLCHPDGSRWLDGLGIEGAGPQPCAEGRFTLSVEQPRQDERGQRRAYRLTAPPDPALLAALRDAFAQKPARQPLAGVPAKVSVSDLAKGDERASLLRRPSFMYASGLTAAERGTAQHSYLQYADLALAQADPAAERERLVAEGYLTRQAADAVDLDGVRAFFASPLAGRIKAAQTLLREYDFITALPAGALRPSLPPPLADEPVLVQGIADLVLVHRDSVEIVDYKTDRADAPGPLAEKYAGQLALYRLAVERRLEKPVTRLTIWSFALNREIELPLE